MTVGLRVYNEAGITQISDDHQGFALIGKGVVQGEPYNGNAIDVDYGAEISVTSPNPVLFAASAPGGAIAHLVAKEGNVHKGFVLYGLHGQPATWYAFSYPKNLSNNLGMQVFNSAGKMVFDAAQKPLRIAHISMVGLPNPPIPNNSNTVFSPSQGPDDIFVSQTRKNRTYAAMGIHLVPWRQLEKNVSYGTTKYGYGLFYYMPVQDYNGIRLKARWACLRWYSDQLYGTETLGHGSLSYSYGNQVTWIIDVTGY